MIEKPKLVTKEPVGNGVNKPVYGSNDVFIPIPSMSIKMSTPAPASSEENLSAKFKSPNVSQEIPEAAKNQYMAP